MAEAPIRAVTKAGRCGKVTKQLRDGSRTAQLQDGGGAMVGQHGGVAKQCWEQQQQWDGTARWCCNVAMLQCSMAVL
jgi:hypothetical protein